MTTSEKVKDAGLRAARRTGTWLSNAGEQAAERLPDRDQVERGAVIAGGMLAKVLRESANRIEGKPKQRRRWPWLLLGLGIGAATVYGIERLKAQADKPIEAAHRDEEGQTDGAEVRSIGGSS